MVYEYSLCFSDNELEEDDVAHFNHEFLQSMGISIAKHRLEIIKLSKKQTHRHSHLRPVKKLLVAIKRTKRCLQKCLRALVGSSEPSDWETGSALVVVQRQRLIPRRDRDTSLAKQGRLMMLTNGVSSGRSRVNSFSSPLVYNHKTVQDHHHHQDDDQHHDEDHQDRDGYWSNEVQDIRWDTLFQDLKPT